MVLSPSRRSVCALMPLSTANFKSAEAVMRLSAKTSLPPCSSSQPRHTVRRTPFKSSASSTLRSCAVKSVKPSTNTCVRSFIEHCPTCCASTLSRSDGSALPFATTPSYASSISPRSCSLSPSAPSQVSAASSSRSLVTQALLNSSTAPSSIV